MRIVITGGAGFLGSHLCEKFLSLGHSVVAVDNLATGRATNLKSIENNPAFEFRKQDVSQHITVEGPVDAVAHLASPASPPDYLRLQIQTLKVGALGTHNALGLAKAKNARLLLASTSEVYGDPLVNPQPESYWGNVNPVGPRSVYDEAKRFAEAMTLAYQRSHGIDVRIARIFNTYGPRMRPQDGRVVSNFIVQALGGEPLTIYGDGSQTRSFCYVSDLVEGLSRLLLIDGSASQSSSLKSQAGESQDSNLKSQVGITAGANDLHLPVNLGNPVETTVAEIARVIIRLTGSSSQIKQLPLPVDDPKVRCPRIARAQQLLGWNPVVDLESGLRKTIQYFESGD
ncbi:MAG TPA: UDP-glucuronic acid decarboxylase family protein [Terriglobia bacterium]|nr:UDP-glucuronic acid decarboxylase family protein [Terriglobia bacterium]